MSAIDFAAIRRAIEISHQLQEKGDLTHLPVVLRQVVDVLEALEQRIMKLVEEIAD